MPRLYVFLFFPQGDASVPDYWDNMAANSQCQVFSLTSNSQEFIDVQTKFSRSCRNTILKVRFEYTFSTFQWFCDHF